MASVFVQFTQNGQPIVPDLGSVTYTLYGQNGTPVLSDQPVAIPAGATSITIITPPEHDVRTLKYEKRTVVVRWLKGAAPYTQRVVYKLYPFLNHTVTEDEVRSFLGVSKAELEDHEIDLLESYRWVENKVTEAALENALESGGDIEYKANKSILYVACLSVIPSLKLRLAKARSDGPLSWTRFDVENFLELEAFIRRELDEALGVIDLQPEGTYILITKSTPTDPITGG